MLSAREESRFTVASFNKLGSFVCNSVVTVAGVIPENKSVGKLIESYVRYRIFLSRA